MVTDRARHDVSDRALLVETDGPDDALRWSRAWQGIPGIVEVVPAARTVLVRFDPARLSRARLEAALAEALPDEAARSATEEVRIRVDYDGEDLAEVAGLLGCTPEELIARHLAASWRVAFTGFAPGFGYLTGSDPLFDVPRRSSPRTRVPAGAVALAGPYTGVYPRESPGGWQLIGRTDARIWDADRDPPALLVPGTDVRFVRAERGTLTAAPMPAVAPEAPARTGGTRIEVVRPALQLLVQDRGRPGLASIGVSPSGAADRIALADANRAVGNAAGAAVLEALGGTTLLFHGGAVVAVAGAEGDVAVIDGAGEPQTVRHGAPFLVRSGEHLELGHPRRGLRSVIAVRGGLSVPSTLGSAATDTLGGLGPAPLRAGDTVVVGDPRTAPNAVAPDPVPRLLPTADDVVELPVVLGPRDDWFTEAAFGTLFGQEWEVTGRSDRIGIRLHGEIPLERAIDGELASEGTVRGALQVPPDGQPVLFLADHPVTGGYPVIAAVAARALDLTGQLPPGARVRFVPDPAPQ